MSLAIIDGSTHYSIKLRTHNTSLNLLCYSSAKKRKETTVRHACTDASTCILSFCIRAILNYFAYLLSVGRVASSSFLSSSSQVHLYNILHTMWIIVPFKDRARSAVLLGCPAAAAVFATYELSQDRRCAAVWLPKNPSWSSPHLSGRGITFARVDWRHGLNEWKFLSIFNLYTPMPAPCRSWTRVDVAAKKCKKFQSSTSHCCSELANVF